MKTIEEKAKEYAHVNRGIYVTEKHVEKAYIAGAQDAVASAWRDAKVELPDNGTMVFVLRGIGSVPELSFYRRDGIFTYDIDLINVPEVTHWMYVPKMPKN